MMHRDILTNQEKKVYAAKEYQSEPTRSVGDAPVTIDTGPTARERAWFKDRLARGKSSRFSEVTDITPGLALLMIELNSGNRPLSQEQDKWTQRQATEGRFRSYSSRHRVYERLATQRWPAPLARHYCCWPN